jgi:hypothetical protein
METPQPLRVNRLETCSWVRWPRETDVSQWKRAAPLLMWPKMLEERILTIIETDRLTLHDLTMDYVDALFEIFADAEV